MKNLLLVGVTLLVVGVVGLFFIGFEGKAFSLNALWGDVESFEEKATFNSDGVEEIEVDVSSTDVQIIKSDSDEISVRYYGESNHADKIKKSFYARTSGSSLEIGTGNTVNIGIQYISDQLEISLPEKSWKQLKLNSSSGDMNARDVSADDIQLKLSSGDIELTNVQAQSLSVQTSSGSFEGEQIDADITARTSSGDVELSNQPLQQNVEINSSSGDVSIQTDEKPANLYVQFDSSSGEATIDFPMQFSSMDESHIKGTVGEGTYKIEVRTSSGDFDFRK